MEILIIVGLVVIVVIIIALASSSGTKSEPEWKKVLKANIYSAENKSNSSNYYEVKDSLVELDKLLDFALKNKRVKGETLGERLKNAKSMFNKSDYNALWEAHKLRNQLVHEVGQGVNVNTIRHNSKIVSSILRKSI